jgi:hypothetical protein
MMEIANIKLFGGEEIEPMSWMNQIFNVVVSPEQSADLEFLPGVRV